MRIQIGPRVEDYVARWVEESFISITKGAEYLLTAAKILYETALIDGARTFTKRELEAILAFYWKRGIRTADPKNAGLEIPFYVDYMGLLFEEEEKKVFVDKVRAFPTISMIFLEIWARACIRQSILKPQKEPDTWDRYIKRMIPGERGDENGYRPNNKTGT